MCLASKRYAYFDYISNVTEIVISDNRRASVQLRVDLRVPSSHLITCTLVRADTVENRSTVYIFVENRLEIGLYTNR